MSIYGKFKVKDSLNRNLLSRSNMGQSLAVKNIKGVNELFMESSNSKILPEIGKSKSIMDHCLADETSEGVQKTSRHVFIRSKMV